MEALILTLAGILLLGGFVLFATLMVVAAILTSLNFLPATAL